MDCSVDKMSDLEEFPFKVEKDEIDSILIFFSFFFFFGCKVIEKKMALEWLAIELVFPERHN